MDWVIVFNSHLSAYMYLIGNGHEPSCSEVLSKHKLMSLGRAMCDIPLNVLEQMHTCSFPSYPGVAFRRLSADTLVFFTDKTFGSLHNCLLGKTVGLAAIANSHCQKWIKLRVLRWFFKKIKRESFCSFTDTYGSLGEESVFLLSLIKLSCIPGLH